MDWRDEGILLAVRRHGESAAIVEVFTAEHGRHAGLVHGGASRRIAPVLQPGAQLAVAWRARVEGQLGTYTVEPIRPRAAALLADAPALAGLASVTALAAVTLPEREADPAFYEQTCTVLDLIGQSLHWPYAYLLWERALLQRAGLALDLDRCAASGTTEDLAFVSPRTGRAVSRAAAGVWASRLLPLPPPLRGTRPPDHADEILQGLATTGFFLEKRLAPTLAGGRLPPARARLVAALARKA